MAYNDNRFELPPLFFIGGTNKGIKLSLKDAGHGLFGDVKDCQISTSGDVQSNNWLVEDRTSLSFAPSENEIYRVVTEGEYKDKLYVWNGQLYCEFCCYFSMINYSSQYYNSSSAITIPCNIQNGNVIIPLTIDDTIGLYGKYIYQLSFYELDPTNALYSAKQGLMVICRNIDVNIAENVINTSESTDEESGPIYTDEHIVFIVGSVEYATDWLSFTENGEPLVPEMYVIYTVESGDYQGSYVWDGNENYTIYEE